MKDKFIAASTTPAQRYWRRARGEIACVECRRLKLKCDRKIPCGRCTRRGCTSICPNGAAEEAQVQGSRIFFMHPDTVHQKVEQMSERIHVLEEALASVYARLEPGTAHPLLHQDFMSIKNLSLEEEEIDEAEESVSDTLEALSISPNGAVQYFGRLAGTEAFFMKAPHTELEQDGQDESDYIRGTFDTFPFSYVGSRSLEDTIASLKERLPSYKRALELVDIYYEMGVPHFRPLKRPDLLDMIITPAYKGHQNAANANTFTEPSLHPHHYGLVYAILAASAQMDLTQLPNNEESKRYHDMCKEALSVRSIFQETTYETVVALGFLTMYVHVGEKSRTALTTHAYWGVTCLFAQNLGLHRDPSRWGLSPRFVDMRRRTFWAINTMDHFQALTTGRPVFFAAKRVDCQFPIDDEQSVDGKNEAHPGFWAWKDTAARNVLAELISAMTNVAPPSYQLVLSFDRKIRELLTPVDLTNTQYDQRSGELEGPSSQWMQRFVASYLQHIALIYLHRTFFARCCQDHPTSPLESPYATSYRATYESSMAIIRVLKDECGQRPHLIVRLPHIWTHAFSAAIIIGTAILRGPNNSFAASGLIDLAHCVGLFEKAAESLKRPRIAMPYLLSLLRRAHRSYTDYTTNGRLDPNPRSDELEEDENADFVVFGGQTPVFVRGGASLEGSPPHCLAAVQAAMQSVHAFDNSLPQTVLPAPFDVPPSTALCLAQTGYRGGVSTDLDAAVSAYPEGLNPRNEDFGSVWGIPNLLDTGAAIGLSSENLGIPSAEPTEPMFTDDMMNLFGLDPTVGPTQTDDSWANIVRDFWDGVLSGGSGNMV